MIIGRVVGRVWATKRLPALPQGALLEIEAEGHRLVAFDRLGCGVGERVLVVQGSVAAGQFGEARAPVDALVVGSIDEPTG